MLDLSVEDEDALALAIYRLKHIGYYITLTDCISRGQEIWDNANSIEKMLGLSDAVQAASLLVES